MAFTTFAKNKMIDHITDSVQLYVGVFSEDASTGTDIQTNGRQLVTFTADSVDGSVSCDVVSALNIPESSTVTDIGVFDDITAGNLIISYTLPVPEVFVNEGEIVLDGLTLSLS